MSAHYGTLYLALMFLKRYLYDSPVTITALTENVLISPSTRDMTNLQPISRDKKSTSEKATNNSHEITLP